MKHLIRYSLLGLWSLALGRPAAAQAPADPPTEAAPPDSLALIKGFGLAHITEPNGQTHRVFVPAGLPGFVGMLPFYRHGADIRPLARPGVLV